MNFFQQLKSNCFYNEFELSIPAEIIATDDFRPINKSLVDWDYNQSRDEIKIKFPLRNKKDFSYFWKIRRIQQENTIRFGRIFEITRSPTGF